MSARPRHYARSITRPAEGSGYAYLARGLHLDKVERWAVETMLPDWRRAVSLDRVEPSHRPFYAWRNETLEYSDLIRVGTALQSMHALQVDVKTPEGSAHILDFVNGGLARERLRQNRAQTGDFCDVLTLHRAEIADTSRVPRAVAIEAIGWLQRGTGASTARLLSILNDGATADARGCTLERHHVTYALRRFAEIDAVAARQPEPGPLQPAAVLNPSPTVEEVARAIIPFRTAPQERRPLILMEIREWAKQTDFFRGLRGACLADVVHDTLFIPALLDRVHSRGSVQIAVDELMEERARYGGPVFPQLATERSARPHL